jgi:hypothetical protein
VGLGGLETTWYKCLHAARLITANDFRLRHHSKAIQACQNRHSSILSPYHAVVILIQKSQNKTEQTNVSTRRKQSPPIPASASSQPSTRL